MDYTKKYKNLIIMAIVFFLYYIHPITQLLYAKIIGIPFVMENDQLVLNISDSLALLLKLFSDLTFGIVLIIIYKKALKIDFKKYISSFKKNILISLKYWLIGLAIMASSTFIVNIITNSSTSVNQKALYDTIKASPIVAIIITVFLSPFIEEIVYRKTLRDVIKSKIPFILTSGLLFGAVHVISSLSIGPLGILYLIPYSAVGICFGLIYYKTDSIFSTIFIHILHNGLIMLFYLLML